MDSSAILSNFAKKSETAAPQVTRQIDKTKLKDIEVDLTPLGVWNAFVYATSDWTNLEREAKWFEIVRRAVPGRYQFTFTEDDWRRILAEFRGDRPRNLMGTDPAAKFDNHTK